MVRMVDVAEAAGVSPMTVSNVVNRRPGVSADTRMRVLQAVDELGYRVNASARTLRTGRSGAIGLILPEVDGPYYPHLSTRLSAGAQARGRHLLVERTGATRERELEAISFGHLRRFEGAVVNLVQIDSADLERVRFDTPVVFIGERPVPRRFDHVMMDNVGGGLAATDHLLSTGSRRVVIIGGRHEDADDMTSLRTRGYRQAHDDRGLTVDDSFVIEVEAYSWDQGYRAVMSLHEASLSFDAVFAVTDALAMGALRALADLGLGVPGDVQVIGFDNGPETNFTIPRLSSVDPGGEALADLVLDLLERRIRSAGGNDERAPATITMNSRLVLRESTR